MLLQLTENEVKLLVPRDGLAYAEAPEDDKLLETQRKLDRLICLSSCFLFKVQSFWTFHSK